MPRNMCSKVVSKYKSVSKPAMSSPAKRKASSQDPETETPSPTAIVGSAPLPGKLAADLLFSYRADPDGLCDVTLIGSDDGRVPAIRALLSCRSKMFMTMLLGGFSERQADEVPTPYPSDVLKCLVEYCLSDKVEEFHELIHGKEKESGNGGTAAASIDANKKAKTDATAVELLQRRLSTLRTMVGTIAAADYFELRGLHSMVEDMLLGLLKFDAATEAASGSRNHKICDICFIWQASMEYPSLSKLQTTAFDHIINNTYSDLVAADGREDDPPGVMVLSSKSLLHLAKDERLKVRATNLFDAIKIWSDAMEGPLGGDEEDSDRMATAKECASHIELRLIQPTKLLGAVQESGLYESDTIVKITREQSKGRAVFVAGAGTDYVNGWYKPSEMSGEGLQRIYEKEGTIDGVATRIFLSQRKAYQPSSQRPNPATWTISAPPPGAGILSPSDRKLYWTKYTTLTPFNVWIKDSDNTAHLFLGEEPCPRAVLTPGLKDDC